MTDFRPLVEAVLEALTVSPADHTHPDRCLNDRVMYARIVLKAALEDPSDIAWEADYLRRKLAEYPITPDAKSGQ